jgi:hypothetical protein
MSRRIFSAVGALALAGCASTADKVTATYVSPMQYDAYDCRQLADEAQRISAHASAAAGAQDIAPGLTIHGSPPSSSVNWSLSAGMDVISDSHGNATRKI